MGKVIILVVFLMILSIIAFARNSPASVTNGHTEQRSGAKLFEKTYDASDTTGTVMDIDSNVYRTIKIGDQWWMAENLKVTRYRNGDTIPNVTGDSEWSNLSTGACSAYNNDESFAETYGYLYNWYAVNDNRKLAPEGWHIATDDDWKELEMYLGMSQSEADDLGWRGTDEGGKLKEVGTAHWNSPNTGATNESGFTALPGGFRGSNSGNFYFIGGTAYFWSSTEFDSDSAWYRRLYNTQSDVGRYYDDKQSGFSVRCVRGVIASSIDDDSENVPENYNLLQNYPNPFNPITRIEYTLPRTEMMSITIYDLLGKEVKRLTGGIKPVGRYTVVWNGRNDAGEAVASGVYFYILKTENRTLTKKLLVMK